MSDLIERLRERDRWWQGKCDEWLAAAKEIAPERDLSETEASMRRTHEAEAADRIEALEKELADRDVMELAILQFCRTELDGSREKSFEKYNRLRTSIKLSPIPLEYLREDAHRSGITDEMYDAWQYEILLLNDFQKFSAERIRVLEEENAALRLEIPGIIIGKRDFFTSFKGVSKFGGK